MPKTPEEKIAAIEARMRERREKLAESKLLQRFEAADKKDLQELETTKTQDAKEKAAKKREADNGAKILLGVGVQQFREPLRSRVVTSILPLLDDRGRDRLQNWIKLRDIDLTAPPIGTETAAERAPAAPKAPLKAVDPAPVTSPQVGCSPAASAPSKPPTPDDAKSSTPDAPATPKFELSAPVDSPATGEPTTAAVMRGLGLFDAMTLSMIETEFLKVAQGKDRELLEVLFAQLNEAVNPDLPEVEIVSSEAK